MWAAQPRPIACQRSPAAPTAATRPPPQERECPGRDRDDEQVHVCPRPSEHRHDGGGRDDHAERAQVHLARPWMAAVTLPRRRRDYGRPPVTPAAMWMASASRKPAPAESGPMMSMATMATSHDSSDNYI